MSKRALVVEDDVNIAELLRLYLGKDGFDVMIAPDGGKAGSMFDLFQPDVVLLDIMLPVKDGWQVCREIREISAKPVIMITAKGDVFDKVLGLDLVPAAKKIIDEYEPAYTKDEYKAYVKKISG